MNRLQTELPRVGSTMSESVVFLPKKMDQGNVAVTRLSAGKGDKGDNIGTDAFGAFREDAMRSPVLSQDSTRKNLVEVQRLVDQGKVKSAVFRGLMQTLPSTSTELTKGVDGMVGKQKRRTLKERVRSSRSSRSMLASPPGVKTSTYLSDSVKKVTAAVKFSMASWFSSGTKTINTSSRRLTTPASAQTGMKGKQATKVSDANSSSEATELPEMTDSLMMLVCPSDRVITRMKWRKTNCALYSYYISYANKRTGGYGSLKRGQVANEVGDKSNISRTHKGKQLVLDPDVFVVAGFFSGFVVGDLPQLRKQSGSTLDVVQSDTSGTNYMFSVFNDCFTYVFSCPNKETRDRWVDLLGTRLSNIRSNDWEKDHPIKIGEPELEPSKREEMAEERRKAYELSKHGRFTRTSSDSSTISEQVPLDDGTIEDNLDESTKPPVTTTSNANKLQQETRQDEVNELTEYAREFASRSKGNSQNDDEVDELTRYAKKYVKQKSLEAEGALENIEVTNTPKVNTKKKKSKKKKTKKAIHQLPVEL